MIHAFFRFSFVPPSKRNETIKKNLRGNRDFPEYGETKTFPAKTIKRYLNEVEKIDESVLQKDPTLEQQKKPFYSLNQELAKVRNKKSESYLNI